MGNNDFIINDDLLDEVYLAKKRLGDTKKMFDTNHESFYKLDDHIILCTPLDESDLTFRMINTTYRTLNSDYEPMLEIYVDPSGTTIDFVSTSLGKSTTRFMATFDHLEKNWDVRSYMNGFNKLSTLKDSLSELLTLPHYSQEEYKGFVALLEHAKLLGLKERERKLSYAGKRRP